MLVKSKQTGRMLNVPDAFYQANPQLYQTEQTQQPAFPQTNAQPQQDFMTSALNFGKDALIGMASPFIRTGQNIIGSLFESARGGGINAAADVSTGMINQLNQINAQLRIEQDPMKKQALLFKSRQLSDQLGSLGQKSTQFAQAPNPVLNNQELASRSTPMGAASEAARNTAGIMSYAIPYGKAIPGVAPFLSKAVLPGAAQGGLFAASKEGATAGDVAGGTIGGGLTSGTLYGLGKLLGGIKGAGGSLRKTVLNPQEAAGNTPYAPKIMQELTDFAKTDPAITAVAPGGLSGGASQQWNQLNRAWDVIDGEVGAMVKNTKTEALLTTAEKNFEESLKKTNYLKTLPGYEEAAGIMKERLKAIFNHGSAGAESIYALKSEVRKELSKVFEKAAMTPKEEVKVALFDSLKSTLDDIVPAVRDLNIREAKMFDLASGLAKKANSTFRVPLLGFHLPEEGFQAVTDALGSLMQKAGGPAGVVNKAQGSGIPVPATQEILRNLMKPNTPAVPYPTGNVPTPDGANTPSSQPQTREQGGNQITFNQLQQILLSPKVSDKTKAQFKYIYDEQQKMSGGGKKMSSVTAKDLSRNQTALKDIGQFEQILATDPGAILKSSIPGSIGAREYRALWGSIIDSIGTNRTGAAYTKEQRGDYAYLLPSVGDTPQAVQMKMQRLRGEIETYLNNLGQSSSVDVTGLSTQQ